MGLVLPERLHVAGFGWYDERPARDEPGKVRWWLRVHAAAVHRAEHDVVGLVITAATEAHDNPLNLRPIQVRRAHRS
jgi:hypothetical protein